MSALVRCTPSAVFAFLALFIARDANFFQSWCSPIITAAFAAGAASIERMKAGVSSCLPLHWHELAFLAFMAAALVSFSFLALSAFLFFSAAFADLALAAALALAAFSTAFLRSFSS